MRRYEDVDSGMLVNQVAVFLGDVFILDQQQVGILPLISCLPTQDVEVTLGIIK